MIEPKFHGEYDANLTELRNRIMKIFWHPYIDVLLSNRVCLAQHGPAELLPGGHGAPDLRTIEGRRWK